MRISFWLRWLGYGLLAIGTLELIARIEDYLRDGAPLFKPYTINTVFRPSPYGREGVPGARYAKWQMNSLGYRSPEVLAHRINILTFGASETFGLYESAGREFPRMLESRLNGISPDTYSVVNIALPGIRIGRVGYLDRAIQQTGARYVVIYPSPANYIGTTVPFCRQESTPIATTIGLADRIRLLGKIDQQAKKMVPQGVFSSIRALSIWWSGTKGTSISRVPDETLIALREDLQCVVQLLRQYNAVPILVTHATYFGETVTPDDHPMMLAWRRFYPELAEDGFMDLERRANEVIRLTATKEGVLVVDAAASIPRGPEHFADFVHFTDKGADLMGSLIARAINSLPDPPRRERISPPPLSTGQ